MKILPCTREHIPDVVELLTGGGPRRGPGGRTALCRYLEEVYFDNPWYDPELTSLVFEDGSGRINGFLGVLARPMVLRDSEPIRAAASSNFRVRGADGQAGPRHPFAAIALLKRFFEGPQDLSVANGANRLSKKIWEACGGVSLPLYSLDWLRVIRPARAVLELAAGQRSRPLPRGLRLLADTVDLGAGNWLIRRALPDRGGADYELHELDAASVIDGVAHARGLDLKPRYDADSLAWLLELGRRKAVGGRSRAIMVREQDQQRAVGWFVYYQKRERVGEVLQLVAADGQLETVLRAAIRDAAAQGLALLRGDVYARDLQIYRNVFCLLNTGRWMLVHSRRPALVETFVRGRALFTGLDGERWIKELGREPI
jgi:hypothetical protein